jgi:hypothetical protein
MTSFRIIRANKLALLERDIESLMFERRIKQSLANNTMLDILKIRAVDGGQEGFKVPDNNLFL